MLRSTWKLLGVIVVALLGVALTAGSAQAVGGGNTGDFGTNFVDGGDVLTDDWGDNFSDIGNSLCYGCGNNKTDIVVMWQAILYAEGLLPKSGIDGDFGAATDLATEKWQARFGLTADGWVGDATWEAADNRLSWYWSHNSKLRYDAKGTDGNVAFMRGNFDLNHDSGAYLLYAVDNGTSGSTFFNHSAPSQRIYTDRRTVYFE